MVSTNKTHLPSLGMLLLSGGGAFTAFVSATGLGLAGIMDFLRGSAGSSDSLGLISLACSAGLIFILLLPSTVLAAIRLMGGSIPEWHFPWFYTVATAGFLLVPILIGLGFFIGKNANWAVFLLPLFQLAVVAFPLWWLLEIGKKNLPPSSSQHNWGLFTFSVTTTMPIILVIESLLVLGIITGILIYFVAFSPQVLEQLSTTLNRLVSSSMDREAVLRVLRPYLSQPAFIYFLIAIAAGVIPLLEELLKPLALWFFSTRPLSPRDGFIGGMICGAAFALLESLGAMADPAAESWSVIAFGRIGTGILHITASGLVGWGMGKAWSEGKYLSLAGAYTAAVSFHALWNISALMTGLRELAQFSPLLIGQLDGFILASPFILVLLAFFMISIIMRVNNDLHKRESKTLN